MRAVPLERPVADAGPDQPVITLGTTVALTGVNSYDPDGDAITYQWTLVQKQAGSAATLAAPTSATPSFPVDVHGEYVAELVVSDS